jgi:hypothetical protein
VTVQLINVPDDIVSVLAADYPGTSYAWGMDMIPEQTRYVKLGDNCPMIAAKAAMEWFVL